MDKITIHYGIQGNGISFGLTYNDYQNIKKNFPNAQPSQGVFIEYDIRSDFKTNRPLLEKYVFPALLGFPNETELKKIKTIEFVKTPGFIVTHTIKQNYEQEIQLIPG